MGMDADIKTETYYEKKNKSSIFHILYLSLAGHYQIVDTEGNNYVCGHYQIVDTEGNNYVLGDSVFLLEFNSADDYAMIKEGKKYKVYGYWFRLPLMSWFPKIYKYKEIE